jgi:hypothetical protein
MFRIKFYFMQKMSEYKQILIFQYLTTLFLDTGFTIKNNKLFSLYLCMLYKTVHK